MVNMVAVPERLENTVGKAHEHDVLNRLLAQEVVHSVDLRLSQAVAQLRVEGLSGRQIMAKRLFHHHSAPKIIGLSHQPRLTEVVDNAAKKPRAHSQVEHHVFTDLLRLLHLFEFLTELLVRGSVSKVC